MRKLEYCIVFEFSIGKEILENVDSPKDNILK